MLGRKPFGPIDLEWRLWHLLEIGLDRATSDESKCSISSGLRVSLEGHTRQGILRAREPSLLVRAEGPDDLALDSCCKP